MSHVLTDANIEGKPGQLCSCWMALTFAHVGCCRDSRKAGPEGGMHWVLRQGDYHAVCNALNPNIHPALQCWLSDCWHGMKVLDCKISLLVQCGHNHRRPIIAILLAPRLYTLSLIAVILWNQNCTTPCSCAQGQSPNSWTKVSTFTGVTGHICAWTVKHIMLNCTLNVHYNSCLEPQTFGPRNKCT